MDKLQWLLTKCERIEVLNGIDPNLPYEVAMHDRNMASHFYGMTLSEAVDDAYSVYITIHHIENNPELYNKRNNKMGYLVYDEAT